VTRPAGVVAIASLIAAGGFAGASPAICRFPSPLRYAGPNFSSGAPYPGTSQTPPTREDVDKAINDLGAFDYDQRMAAARVVRRAPGTVALPALVDAAAGHADSFVRYRALVLLSGYDDPRVPDQMEQALGEANDRLRTVAFSYFERYPDRRLIPAFLKAMDGERAEFVRPALMRALAAQARDPRVQGALVKDLTRGPEDVRASAIEALGDHRAASAVRAISQIAELDGPFREDAVLALGKIGDPASVGLVEGLQKTAGPETQPTLATALCLLGNDCQAQREVLVRTLRLTDRPAGFLELLRTSASGLSALAVNGDVEAGRALVDIGVPAVDPVRTPVAVALARLAASKPVALVALVEQRQDRDQALQLLRDGFDLLEDDFGEEQFFVAVRNAYFTEPEGSARKAVIQAVINALEF
jgi:HEAT repeat protein